MADRSRIVCPRCRKPVGSGTLKVMDVDAKLLRCGPCGLVAVVGPKADCASREWVSTADPDLTRKLYFQADALS